MTLGTVNVRLRIRARGNRGQNGVVNMHLCIDSYIETPQAEAGGEDDKIIVTPWALRKVYIRVCLALPLQQLVCCLLESFFQLWL